MDASTVESAVPAEMIRKAARTRRQLKERSQREGLCGGQEAEKERWREIREMRKKPRGACMKALKCDRSR